MSGPRELRSELDDTSIEREASRILTEVRKLYVPWMQGTPGPNYAEVRELRRQVIASLERIRQEAESKGESGT